ncbi:uncharacterized protein LOC135489508 isoform X2 [Lineus longissimus]|uniref:uncharacterized protein LOC135489508 isoform X2 n=1 Tax=Lineus longissimus TaxID=88925 RepID=UPI002B4D9014
MKIPLLQLTWLSMLSLNFLPTSGAKFACDTTFHHHSQKSRKACHRRGSWEYYELLCKSTRHFTKHHHGNKRSPSAKAKSSHSTRCRLPIKFRSASQTDSDLLSLLQLKGGDYVPQYMATDESQAAKQFTNLLTMSTQYADPLKKDHIFDRIRDNARTRTMLSTDFDKLEKTNWDVNVIKNSKKKYAIKPGRRRALKLEKLRNKRQTANLLNHLVTPAQAGITQSVVNGTDGSVTRIEYCQMKGSVTSDGYLHMCTTCAATTTLPEDRFPRMINEAICAHTDRDCLTVHGTAHGKCTQKVFHLNMLRKRSGVCRLSDTNGTTVVLDDWELYTQPIRVCCECLIDARSLFAPYIGT